MKLFWPFLISIIFSCAHQKSNSVARGEATYYDFKDMSGSFHLKRQTLIRGKNKVATKTTILSNDGEAQILEKTIVVSDYGELKFNRGVKKLLRPRVAQHRMWLEKKLYFSQLTLQEKKRSIEVILRSPEERWNGKQSIKLPSGKAIYCFYSQIPECLQAANVWEMTQTGKIVPFYIVWESFPYMGEQYVNVKAELFTKANARMVERDPQVGGRGTRRLKNVWRYSVNFGNHSILYDLDSTAELVNLFWIAQGIVINKQGE